uniref:Uncharacterized protein n=1 Tax=Oryza punctata TaxID=4537 RepID=A0A0E0KPW0_ORYPU
MDHGTQHGPFDTTAGHHHLETHPEWEELWCERNVRIFRNSGKPAITIIAKIKDEATVWGLAGASS